VEATTNTRWFVEQVKGRVEKVVVVSPNQFGVIERIKAREGGGKAIIAAARKFLGIIYRMLKSSRVFEDFPNFVLAED
jgi:hypothetical protein